MRVLRKAASSRVRLLGWHWLQRLVLVEHLPIHVVSACGELGFLTVRQTQMKLKEVPECRLCHASWKGQPRFTGSRGTRWKPDHADREGRGWRQLPCCQTAAVGHPAPFICRRRFPTLSYHCLLNTNTPTKELVRFY